MIQRVPYDWKNPIGYFVTTIYQYISLQRFLGFFGLGAILGLASLLFEFVIIRGMKSDLKSFNNNAIAGEQNKLQAVNGLNEFIKLHSIVKQLSVIYITKKNTSDHFTSFFIHSLMLILPGTLEPFAAVVFASSLATMCCAMLMIQMLMIQMEIVKKISLRFLGPLL